MAWDSKSARVGTGSTSRHPTQPQQAAARPADAVVHKSLHVGDPVLQPFLAPSFDPADFLNNALPTLKTATPPQRDSSVNASLAELSTQTQTLLSQLSAHTTRLTNTLTQLTDEILRSGSRLTYEIEVLRGETIGLSEALTEGLQEDISKFVPHGIEDQLTGRPSRQHQSNTNARRASMAAPKPSNNDTAANGRLDPDYIVQLRTLTSVRDRLDTVIKTFGDAMAWTFPPSELSVSSAFLSVSAPEPGSEAHSMEEKGQEVSRKLRDEIAHLLTGTDDPVECIEIAAQRVQELKELSRVWNGTAEERARTKFVESLAKMVEDRHRELLRELEQKSRTPHHSEISNSRSDEVIMATSGNTSQNAYGFISQLQKMRGL